MRTLGLVLAALTALTLACSVDEEGGAEASDATSDLTAAGLAGKQLAAATATAPFRSIAFEAASGALVYRAERSASGETERGKATVGRGRLLLQHANVTEEYVITERAGTVVLTPLGGDDGDAYAKEPTPPRAPFPPPLLPQGHRRLVQSADGRTFAFSPHVSPQDSRFDALSGFEIDWSGGQWRPLPDLPPGVRFSGGVQLVATADGRIVAVGQRWLGSGALLVELDTKTGTWSRPMPSALRTSFGVGVCPDGNVLAFAGDANDPRRRLDPWPEELGSRRRFVGPPASGRFPAVLDPVVVSTREGLVYLLGGKLAEDAPWAGLVRGRDASRAVAVYDCGKNEVRELAPMISPRARHAATVGEDGRVYVFGGAEGQQLSRVVPGEVYDPRTNTWTELSEPLVPSGGYAARGLEGTIWFGGGSSTVVDAFDPKTARWTSGLSKASWDP